MAKQIHKGTEFNNVNETWDENERRREGGSAGSDASTDATGNTELQRVISDEAAEYDNANKEDRLLGGERATLNDDQEGAGDE